MNTTYTVISTSNIDCYKRASSDSTILINTFDHDQALIVAANAWLEEYNNNFVYEGTADAGHFENVVELLKDDPTSQEIVSYFEDSKFDIYSPEYINDPTFFVEIQASTTKDAVHCLDHDVIEELKSAKFTS